MTVRFHAMNSKKDGVVSKADFEILIERIIKIGKLNDAQAERSRMLLAKLLPLFGGETLKQTLEQFYDTAAKGLRRYLYLARVIRNTLPLMFLSCRQLSIPFGRCIF